MTDCIEIKKDLKFSKAGPIPSAGLTIRRTDADSDYNGYGTADVHFGSEDHAYGVVGVVNPTQDGYIAAGFHPSVAVTGGMTFEPGAILYVRPSDNGKLTDELPTYNGQIILAVAVALEGSDSIHYTEHGFVEALIRIGEPRVQADGIDP